jgi:hypothetical protein
VGVAPPREADLFLKRKFTPFRFGVKAVAIYQIGEFGTAKKQLWKWH